MRWNERQEPRTRREQEEWIFDGICKIRQYGHGCLAHLPRHDELWQTGQVYQMGTSEKITGRYIKDFGLNRDEIVVATKVNFEMRPGRPNGGGLSRKNIMAEIDHSLERLGLDYFYL